MLTDDYANNDAVMGLGAYGPLARDAVPKLVPLLNSPDKGLRRAVNMSLPRIDPAEAARLGIK